MLDLACLTFPGEINIQAIVIASALIAHIKGTKLVVIRLYVHC